MIRIFALQLLPLEAAQSTMATFKTLRSLLPGWEGFGAVKYLFPLNVL